MTKSDLEKHKLPDSPGVYFFKKGMRILYVGKATSLRDRARSYFSADIIASRGPLIKKMLDEASSVDIIKTDSVLEALILEANLIKKHQPPYNTKEKDDKSFNYVVITKEDFPRVLVVRGKELEKWSKQEKYILGPFPHGGIFKDALKIIRKIFPFRDKCKSCIIPRESAGCKPCFDRQIGLCPGVCTGETTKREYQKTIRNIKLFFEGKKPRLIKKLEKEMKTYAKRQEFEKAGRIKRTIFHLKHIQDVSLIRKEFKSRQGQSLPEGFRIEAYDIAHISGTSAVGAMVAAENGEMKKSDYRKFKIKSERKRSDTDMLKEILRRRLNHREWRLPNLIVVDGGEAQINAAGKALKEYGFSIPVVSVVKDERHKPKNILGGFRYRGKYEREIVLANGEAHRFAAAYHRKLRQKIR
jgi:excinuclease ABC subunit C